MNLLQAAAGQVDLAPPVGVWLTGFGARNQPSTSQHDPILARAVLFADGRTLVAVVACDVIGFDAETVAELRQRIAAAGPIAASHILIACTHTHAGPTTMRFRSRMMGTVDTAWLPAAATKIVELVAGLADRLEPARVAWGRTTVAGIGHNRQSASRPIDDELIAVQVESAAGRPLATLVNYATHAVVLGPTNLAISGDYPGATARAIEQARGGVALFLQGACGDVNPDLYRERPRGGTFADVRQIGQALATATDRALATAHRCPGGRVAVRSTPLVLPLDPPLAPAELAAFVAAQQTALRQARTTGDEAGVLFAQAYLQWAAEFATARAAGRVPVTLPVELQVVAIDDLRLIALPLELYHEIGLAIKRGVAPLPAMVVGYANGLFGYCATDQAKAEGGYGPAGSFPWFPKQMSAIGYGAAELVAREAVALGRRG
jgi:hypothetical protein